MKGNKIVLKAPEGITFKVQEEKDGVIVIEAVYDALEEAHQESFEETVSTYNYANPIIPEGFVHVFGEWNNGFTIRNMADGSDFVWIPVGSLEADGTLDGENFDQQFGRRNFRGEEFSNVEDYAYLDFEMIESIKKYGGFYISAYVASYENDNIVFKKGNMPCVNINQYKAVDAAEHYSDGNSQIVTCLPSGVAYDTIFKWIIQSGEKTFEEVVNDSTNWGNYWDSENSARKVTVTGSREKWSACNIYDIAGNCYEWSTEQYEYSFIILRGGNYGNKGADWPAAERYYYGNPYKGGNFTSFRAMLYVK